MEVLYQRPAGLDVHKEMVWATVRMPDLNNPSKRISKTKTFKSFHRNLVDLAMWLREMGAERVAMESTGVYWVPVYDTLREVLGESFPIDVVNAQHFKAVPGHKTDVKDSDWLAQLEEAGLLKGSFIPPTDVRHLRDVARYHNKLIQERSREKQRLLKTLEQAGIKLDVVASDTFGVSGRLMLDALVAGQRDPEVLAELAKGRLRSKIDELRLALTGRFSEHHAFMVQTHLARLDRLDEQIDKLTRRLGALYCDDDGEIVQPARADGLIAPFASEIALLMSIPGIKFKTAVRIIAEIGTDMSKFPSASHLASWAGLSPGNNESAGKRRRSRRRKGDTHLTTAMVEAASTLARSDNRLGARFRNLARRFGGQTPRRRGKRDNGASIAFKRATFAMAHTLIKIVYHVLSTGQPYQDLGADFYDRAVNPEARVRSLVDRLERLTGKKVTISGNEEDAGETVAA